MSQKTEQISYDISLGDDDMVTIEAEGCTIHSEFFADRSIKRTTMNPVKILFAAFAL